MLFGVLVTATGNTSFTINGPSTDGVQVTFPKQLSDEAVNILKRSNLEGEYLSGRKRNHIYEIRLAKPKPATTVMALKGNRTMFKRHHHQFSHQFAT